MVMMHDPNWTGPGLGPMIDVPSASEGTVYQQVKTEVSRIDNGDGTFTVTYRDSTDPNAPTYTETVGTKTVAPDLTNVTNLFMGLGPRVEGAVKTYIDEVYAGVQSGKYSVADAENALKIIGLQADQGMTGAYGTAQGVVAVALKDDGSNDGSNDNSSTGDEFATATSIIQNVLKFYGMDDPRLLADVKRALADRRLTETSTVDDIGIQLRESAAFQERFSANEVRRKANKPAYSVSQYLQLESAYRNTLLAAGMPADFYNTPEDFSNFIANDISPDEIKARVDQGYASVKNADPAVVNELKSMYGLDDSTLAAFFVDPARTKDAVVRAARAAEVASQARQQAGISLGAPAAELLVQQGVTQDVARQGFSEVAQLQELTRPLQGEQALTQEELIAGKLGTNAAAAQRVAKTQRRRTATFQEGGSFAEQNSLTQSNRNVGLTTVGQ